MRKRSHATRHARRPAVTSLEYLVMISSILVVCILVIGHLGWLTTTSFGGSSSSINKATSNTPPLKGSGGSSGSGTSGSGTSGGSSSGTGSTGTGSTGTRKTKN